MTRTFRGIWLLFVILVILAAGLGNNQPAQANLSASETPLIPGGAAYEINPDNSGVLWVTDYVGGEIRGINPVTNEYDAFPVGGLPADGRQAGGWLWWVDGINEYIGRVSTSSGDYEHWPMPSMSNVYSTALDSLGRLFAVDGGNSSLYRLELDSIDPNTAELCTYALPVVSVPGQPDQDWLGSYSVISGDYLWMGDTKNGRMLRLEISTDDATIWTLEDGNSPWGVTVDTLGNLWYVDQYPHSIVKLDPNTNLATRYTIPSGGIPEMLSILDGIIIYTTQGTASIGRLDPPAASYTQFTPSLVVTKIEPGCSPLLHPTTGHLTKTHASFSWSPESYPLLDVADGWRIYGMPTGSDPWGVTLMDYAYVVDPGTGVTAGRNILSRFRYQLDNTYLPMLSKQ